MVPGNPVSTLVVDTYDLGEAEVKLSAAFSKSRIGTRSGDAPTWTRCWRSHVGSVTIDDAYLTYDMSYDSEPSDKMLLCRVRTGLIDAQYPDWEAGTFGTGDVGAFSVADGVPFGGHVDRAHYNIVMLDRNLLGKVAALAPGSNLQSVRLTGSAPVSRAANKHMVDAIDYVCHCVAANPEAMEQPLIAEAVERYLAASVLATFPNNAPLEATAEDRHDGTPAVVRRAIEFIEEHAQAAMSVADIAAAVYVTPRALQYAFRRHRDCTPMEYVRKVRLQYAHRDLARSDALTTTVADVARRWGFGHLGRFAAYYRQAYGESPHDTLRQ
ncbi:HTH-type transcriptional activator RhaS [Mycobacterium simulans]|uniref:HTH-type transcriptional activator RhaS n=1 Tax=Mycobacterium simulans TaxID=627089 RepID=A0A7Z7IQU0_9MYCO|nr:helix-turn-helix transcriptional regulator [Mycobacterium simulans]SOJ56815.1 HTH-type transcriptional activator RhaS [Mycobacterium simulans]